MTDLEQHQAAAIEDAVACHTVGISQGEQIYGTGVAVAYAGHFLIVTAKHVLKGIPRQELMFCPKAAGGLVRNKPGETKRFTNLMTARKFATRDVHSVAGRDMAVIELDELPSNAPFLQFFQLIESSILSPENGAEVLLLGYPSDVAQEIQNRTIFGTASEFGEVVDHRLVGKKLSGFDSNSHLLVKYSLEQYGIGPHGFSGSGVWLHQDPIDQCWYPNLRLTGITLTYYKDNKLIKALHSQVLLNSLKDLGFA